MKKPIEMIDDLQRQHSMGPYEFVSVEDCVKLMEEYAKSKAGQHETIVMQQKQQTKTNMYYEEKVINGKLMYRTHPDGDWSEVSYEDLLTKYNQGKENLQYQRYKISELQEKLEKLEQLAMDVKNDPLFA